MSCFGGPSPCLEFLVPNCWCHRDAILRQYAGLRFPAMTMPEWFLEITDEAEHVASFASKHLQSQRSWMHYKADLQSRDNKLQSTCNLHMLFLVWVRLIQFEKQLQVARACGLQDPSGLFSTLRL